MKKIFSLFSIVLFAGLVFLSGCNKKDDTAPVDNEQQRIENLSKTWIPGTVTFDGGATSFFNAFELTMGNKTYTSTNGYPVFRNTGTWNFKDNSGTPDLSRIILDGNTNLELEITSLNAANFSSKIILSNDVVNGRTQGTNGTYVLNLVVKP